MMRKFLSIKLILISFFLTPLNNNAEENLLYRGGILSVKLQNIVMKLVLLFITPKFSHMKKKENSILFSEYHINQKLVKILTC